MDAKGHVDRFFDTVFGKDARDGEVSRGSLCRLVQEAMDDERETCAQVVQTLAEGQWDRSQAAIEEDLEEGEAYEHAAMMLEEARNAIRDLGTT